MPIARPAWSSRAIAIAALSLGPACASSGSSNDQATLVRGGDSAHGGAGEPTGAAPSTPASPAGLPGPNPQAPTPSESGAQDEASAPVDSSPIDVVVPVPRPGAMPAPPPSDQPIVEPSESVADAGVDAPADPGSVAADGGVSSSGGFAIELSFQNDGSLDPLVGEAFNSAKARWEAIILGDLPDVTLSDRATCDGYELPQALDDIVIFVTVSAIDGADGVLGAAGPCAIRGRAPRLPFAASMRFDEADLESFATAGRLEEIVLHEMGHALGIGSLWEEFGLIDEPSDGSGAADTAFNGASAREAFDELSGGSYVGKVVPVENLGTPGEINGHWRESAMGSELMTTRMGSNTAQLSVVTVASLEDMGYQVDRSLADEYPWPSIDGSFSFRSIAPPGPDLSHDRLALPLYQLGEDGTLSRVR